MTPINRIDDLEKVTPAESKEFTGYYCLPNSNDYVINGAGNILKNSTGLPVPTHVSPYGYVIVCLFIDGQWKGHRLHRVVATVFIGRPSRHLDKDYSVLHVNHIDGNKLNNSVENLEWCTSTENNRHARQAGLINHDKPVLIRNIITNEVSEIPSAKEFCKRFDVAQSYCSELLYSKQAGRVTVDWHVFKYNDGKPWPEIPLENQVRDSLNRISYWCASNQETGKVVVSDNLRELAQAMDMSFYKLNMAYYSDHGVMGDWEITMKREYSKRDSLERVLRRNKKRTYKIKSTNIETGEIKTHDNCEACSRDLGVKDGKGISYAVLHRSGKPYYGYTFEKLNENHLE